MVRRFLSIAVLVLVAIVLIFSRQIASVFTDILWFDDLGYLSTFWIPISSKLLVGLIVGLVSFVFLYNNLSFTARSIGKSSRVARRFPDASPQDIARAIRRTFLFAALLAAIIAGFAMSSQWMTVQGFLNRTTAGVQDPLFNMDVGFYLFELPFHAMVYQVLISLVIVALIGALVLYLLTGSIPVKVLWTGEGEVSAKFHIAFLVAGLLFLKAWGYRLQALSLVYSTRGVVSGAGYADVFALIPGLRILTVLAIILGVLILVSVFVRSEKLLISTAVIFGVCSIVLGGVFPNLVQKFAVEPSELSRETPYIGYNIESTRRAFGLDKLAVKSLDVNENLTFEELTDEHSDTIENIRLWDWRSLGQTYGQLQEIRAYYDFFDMDLDRYQVGDRTRQMALSARELSVELLPIEAGSWVSEHLVYTHGYGIAMSPTNEVSKEGLPKFIISDIPPQSSYPEFDITRPEIYFGEKTENYVIVNTAAKEFDYPEGDSNAYTVYEGTGGIKLSSLWRRIAFALRFGSSKLLFSADISSDSRVLFDRNIKNRVKRIAPFLKYDEDPYLVLVDGKLVWMLDAYTTSALYPYSQPAKEGFNYIRNSVKIAIDAYNGDVTFYMFDPSDPIVQTLSKIFKDLFVPFDTMPDALKAHVRYPVDLFEIQAKVLCVYHMTAPDTFYNRGDYWEFPMEVYGQQRVEVSPYYVFMKTPGEEQAEYLLILPFVPSGKDNMIGWLMARCDEPRSGELVLYTFPKDRLVYGPMQIESRIDQHPEISQVLTLWSQRGSKVVRGNLLVIPIERSILYVEPLYLLAERSELPELKRVFVAFGDSVAMGDTLEDALRAVFATTSGSVQEAQDAEGKATKDEASEDVESMLQDTLAEADDPALRRLVEDAIIAYKEADKRISEGDFAGFGESLDKLGRLLEELEERTK